MDFEKREQDDFVILKVSGRMDAGNSSEFENHADEILEEGKKKLIIDLENLDYISSAGLRSILISGKKIKAIKGELRLCNLQDDVMEVFEISGFTSIFNIYDSVEAACEG